MKSSLSCAIATIALLAATPARADGPRTDPGPIWTVRGENDKFTTLPLGSDKYYTSGLQVGWTSAPNNVPAPLAALGTALFGDGTQRLAFSLSQQIYTPVDTSLANPNPRDRPDAGYLAGTLSLLHDSGDARTTLALSGGIIGPGAGGKQVQNGFHTLIGVALNKGWRYQLPNEPAVELLGERVWRIGLVSLGELQTDMLPSVTAGVGTVRDYVQTGVLLRVGNGLDSDFGPGKIRPGLTGGDAYQATTSLPWYIFGGVDGQAVARDAFLDGNLFSTSRYVAKKALIGEIEAGFGIHLARRSSHLHADLADRGVPRPEGRAVQLRLTRRLDPVLMVDADRPIQDDRPTATPHPAGWKRSCQSISTRTSSRPRLSVTPLCVPMRCRTTPALLRSHRSALPDLAKPIPPLFWV